MTDDQAAARRRMIDASREAGARWDFRERFAELERSCHRLRTGPFEATFEDYCYQSMWERYWLKRDCRTGDDYANFLQSDLWRKSIRPRVLKRDNRVCFSCGGRANDVHHASYHPLVMAGSRGIGVRSSDHGRVPEHHIVNLLLVLGLHVGSCGLMPLPAQSGQSAAGDVASVAKK
jgi:hypothetical protein